MLKPTAIIQRVFKISISLPKSLSHESLMLWYVIWPE